MNKAMYLSNMTAFSAKIILVFFSVTACAYSASENAFEYPLGFGITASPAIEVSTRHDDNIFLQDDRFVESSWITEVAPSILLGAQKGTDYYSAKYTLEAGRYHSSRDDDYVDHRLNLDSHNEFNHRNKLDLSYDYLKLHEKRGSGISDNGLGRISKTPHEYRDQIFGGKYTYGGAEAVGRIEVDGSYLDKEYTNHRDQTRVFDRDEGAIGATFFYRVMPKTSLLFEAKYTDIEYDNDPVNYDSKLDGDETTYHVGVTWDTTAKTTGTAKIGRTNKDFDASEYKDDDFTSWEVGVEWSPLTYSIFNLNTSSDAQATNGTGSFIRDKTISASWQHAWSYKVSSVVETRFTNYDYKGADREDDLDFYKAGLNYQFRRGVAFAAEYSYEKRDSDLTNFDYTDNVVMFSVKVGM